MGKTIKAVAIIANKGKPRALAKVPPIAAIIRKNGLKALLERDVARLTGLGKYSATLSTLRREPGLVAVLGGDGTFLYAAGIYQGTGIPMLGLNFGTVGFLNEFSFGQFPKVLSSVLRGDGLSESRMMLRADVNGRPVKRDALNEITITRSMLSRALDLKCRINGRYVWSYKTDGIIISTPTGSTAYSLSAHGPIIAPSLESIIINPICPHTLAARAMIVRPDDSVSIDLNRKDDGPVWLTVDGSEGIQLKPGDRVTVRRSGRTIELVTDPGRNFYALLSGKLGWMRA